MKWEMKILLMEFLLILNTFGKEKNIAKLNIEGLFCY